MRLKYLGLLVLAGLLLATAPVRAHHSIPAEYDVENVVKLTGKINRVDWSNPHVVVYLDVINPDGKGTTWAIEGYPPGVMKRVGVPRESLKDGDTLTIAAYKSKNSSSTAAGREVTLPDGSTTVIGNARGWEARK